MSSAKPFFFWRHSRLNILFGVVFLSGIVLAQPAADSMVTRAEQPSVDDWLQKMARSSQRLNYRGTLVYSRGGEIEALLFSHTVDREGVQHERLRSLSGQPREIVRRGDVVLRLHSDGSATRLPHGRSAAPFGRDYIMRLRAAAPYYRVQMVGHTRVAGRPVRLLQLQPRDQYRHAVRLALDSKSGLLMQSIITDRAGQVLERLEYTEISIGIERDSLASFSFPTAVSLSKTPPVLSRGNRHLRHWRLAWVPPGFSSSPSVAAHQPTNSYRALYSDGLATFSVFVRAMSGSTAVRISQPALSLTQGATIVYSTQRKDTNGRYLVTVVGDIPNATAERIAAAVVRTKLR